MSQHSALRCCCRGFEHTVGDLGGDRRDAARWAYTHRHPEPLPDPIHGLAVDATPAGFQHCPPGHDIMPPPTITHALAALAVAAVATLMHTALALDNGLARTPALGFNTWNYWACDSEGTAAPGRHLGVQTACLDDTPMHSCSQSTKPSSVKPQTRSLSWAWQTWAMCTSISMVGAPHQPGKTNCNNQHQPPAHPPAGSRHCTAVQ